MNLTNIDQTECPNKTKEGLKFSDGEIKSEQKFDSLENVQSNTQLEKFQKEQLGLNKQNIQANTYFQTQLVEKNVEENNSQNLFGNDKINASNCPDFLNKSNSLFASIQQVIDMHRVFELEKNEFQQKITEQRVHEELNYRQKLCEYEQNLNQLNVQRKEFDKKLQETQHLFKLSNIIDQNDNQQEIIIKLIQENQGLSTNFNSLIEEQKQKQNKLELKIDYLMQQLEQNNIQKENFKIKYLNLKQNCKKKINKIQQSITQLIEIKQSLNFQFNRIHNFNNQILEQLQVFINQKKELEEMEHINQQNLKLIKQLRYSQNQLIQERQQCQKIINLKQAEFQLLQLQSKEMQLQNQIYSEQLKQIIKSQKSHLENQNSNKFFNQKNIEDINDCEAKSEYADENYGINNNDRYEINDQNMKDQELLSEEPGNDSIENNNNQNQQQNIYLEGESQIEEENPKKDNLLSLKLSDLNSEQQGQSITQKIEFIKKEDSQDKFKQIDDNDQDIPDIQFDDDFLVQINTDSDIKQVKLKDETPLENNIEFDQIVQQVEENNQQSGWDFESI